MSLSTLLPQLAEAIKPSLAVERGEGRAAIDADASRLDALLAGDTGAGGWRLWTNARCLVTTRRFAAMPGFGEASAASARGGWPVFVRPSGGTTVAHRAGTLNASYFKAWTGEGCDAIRHFHIFCEHLADCVRSLGIPANLGRVPGSYCDGSLNLVSSGQKLAGTASLVRRKAGHVGLLCHASLWVTGDVAGDVDAIERFEAGLGLRPSYARKVHTTLQQRLLEPGLSELGLDPRRAGGGIAPAGRPAS